jgi:hypothetical protein
MGHRLVDFFLIGLLLEALEVAPKMATFSFLIAFSTFLPKKAFSAHPANKSFVLSVVATLIGVEKFF